MDKIQPGQVWLSDKDFPYNQGYDGEIAYLIKSKEPNEDWVCVCFQSWNFGGYERMLGEKEIKLMKYVGHISELRKNNG